jgi:hypothetical protein
VVKPPEASATPNITSIPIHRPKGQESFRLVAAPNPKTKRYNIVHAPTKATSKSTIRVNVILKEKDPNLIVL